MTEMEEMNRLEEDFQAYHCAREGERLSPEIIRACVHLVIAGPPELDLEGEWDAAFEPIRNLAESGLPELQMCRIWAAGGGAADEVLSLIQKQLWAPVRALAYSALAHVGRRNSLARLLPGDQSLRLPEADAWMAAAQPAAAAPLSIDTEDVHWKTLLEAEQNADANEAALADLSAKGTAGPASTYPEAQINRIAIRAAAALARLKLNRGIGRIDKGAEAYLPRWEWAFLQGLAAWQRGEKDEAMECLRGALSRNPWQTCIRAALSCLVAERSPEEALEISEHEEPTRDLLILRAALLIRLKRFEDAERTLADEAGWEPVRCSWRRGQIRLRRQETLLRTALAERRGDWNEAEDQWKLSCIDPDKKTLLQARELFILQKQLAALPPDGGWKRDVAERKKNRIKRQIGKVPLTGNARFFRGASMLQEEPQRAIQDILALSRRRVWQDRERRSGGDRLTFAGDALLRWGKPAEAAGIYRSMPDCKERSAIASICDAIMRRAPKEEALAAAEIAPESPWLMMLTALAYLIQGDFKSADDALNNARRKEAPASACARLQTLSAALSGSLKPDKKDLISLGIPAAVIAAVRMIASGCSEPEAIGDFVESLGGRWMEYCPVNPKKLARQRLALLCEEGRYEEAIEWAMELTPMDETWARELVALVRVRRALEIAFRGGLEQAENELREAGNGIIP